MKKVIIKELLFVLYLLVLGGGQTGFQVLQILLSLFQISRGAGQRRRMGQDIQSLPGASQLPRQGSRHGRGGGIHTLQ